MLSLLEKEEIEEAVESSNEESEQALSFEFI